MEAAACDEVRRFLRAVPAPNQHGAALDRLAAHVADCPRCRGALVLFGAALCVPPPPQPLTYEDCQHDLAAYVDLEAASGVAIAARAFPHVWWALWSDPLCIETYIAMCTLRDATAQGLLAPLPLGRAASTPRLTLLASVPRMALAFTLPSASLAYGALRGSAATPLVLIDDELTAGFTLHFSVTPMPGDAFALTVRVAPAVAATLILALGEQEYHAPLDDSGVATVAAVSAPLLTDPTGPDLTISIAPQDG